MIDLDHLERDWRRAGDFRLPVPPDFNFAHDVIDARARERDSIAVVAVSADGSLVTGHRYADLAAASNRFGAALRRLGVAPGANAVQAIGRVPEWYAVLFGCMKAGVVSLPGTNLLTAGDLAFRIASTAAELVIVGAEHCVKIEAIRAECPTLRHLIVIGAERPGWLSFAALSAAESPAPLARLPGRATDTMLAYFTSGTTAKPKLVPRDHAYALAHAATALYWMDHRPGDLHWAVTDTGWAKAAWGMLFPQFLAGIRVLLYEGTPVFDADFHLRLFGRLGVTSFCAPPTVYRMFAKMDLSGYDFATLRRSVGAGEPLNPEAIRIWREATGTTIADGYGQTETINVVGNFPGMESRPGSMGRPVPGFDVDIVGEDGVRLGDGETGHIAIRVTDPWPPGLFRGYLRDGALDTASFRNGWYLTGDMGTRDGDGYIWFVGRADDVILSAAYRISPFEVESTLLRHPAVAESAVVGAPDPVRGQIVRAFIVLRPGHAGDAALARDIQDFCKAETAPYKYPREVRFVPSLPKTVSGKIRRVELRERE